MNMMNRYEVRNLGKSFAYAFRGVAYCIKNERNMRIHLTAVVLVSYFASFYGVSKGEFLTLLLCFGFVICAEAFNTAIEALVNLGSPSYHPFARIAKDVAAGAVVVSAITAVIAGVVLFCLQPIRIWDTLLRIFSNPVWGVLLCVLLALGILFIFNGPQLFGAKVSKAKKLSNFTESHEDKKID